MFCIVFNLVLGIFIGWLTFEQPETVKRMISSFTTRVSNIFSNWSNK